MQGVGLHRTISYARFISIGLRQEAIEGSSRELKGELLHLRFPASREESHVKQARMLGMMTSNETRPICCELDLPSYAS